MEESLRAETRESQTMEVSQRASWWKQVREIVDAWQSANDQSTRKSPKAYFSMLEDIVHLTSVLSR